MNRIDTLEPCVDTVPTGCLLAQDDRTRQGMSLAYLSEVTELQRVLAAKLSLPHQGFVLGRPRLRALVQPARPGGLISVVAGPGYGKTAFIVDLLSSADGKIVYCALDENDRDPMRFLSCLMAGVGAAVPERPPEPVLGWPDSGSSQNAVLEAVGNLIEHMSNHQDGWTLVALDDVHVVDQTPEVLAVLELIIRGLPPGWTVLISSRRPVPLGLDPVSLGGRFVKIQARELRLTPREVAAWARQNWNIPLEPSEARALWRLTEGWPAALVLLGQHLLAGGAGVKRKDLVSLISRGRDLRAYLEAHVFSDMEPLAAEVVMAAGLLPRVVFPRDQHFLPGEAGEAETVLEAFVSRGFLVASTGRRTYTLHPLLRGFVERETWRAEARSSLVERAADHLVGQGEDHQAAYLYLRCAQWDKAAGPLRRLALSSLNAVVSFAREDWLGLIPETAVERQPWLMVVKARILQRQTEYARAGAYYERAARLLSAEGDKEGLLLTLLGSAFCLFNQGVWEESLSVLKRCRTLARSAPEKVEVLVSEGHVLVSLCRWDEAAENWEKALALTPICDRSPLAARIHLHRARLFYALGHYRVARQWADKALAACAQPGTPFRALALNGVAILECATGDYLAAEAHSLECLDLARVKGYGFVEISALLNQASSAMGVRDYRRALARIREAQALAEKAGDAEELFWAEDMLGDLCRRNRNPKRALEHHRRALQIVDENRLAEFERVRASTAVGIDLVLLGREDEGRRSLDETVGLSRRLGLVGSLAPALLYQGWLHALAGREHEAARALTESTKLAAEHGHIHFYCQEASLIVPILALCDRYETGAFVRQTIVPVLPDKLRDYFQELAGGPVYPTDTSLGPPRRQSPAWTGSAVPAEDAVTPEMLGGIDALTDREREVLKLISLGMPNKLIAAKLFITEKTVKTHANHVFRKLGVSSRVQATLVFQSYHRARKVVSGRVVPRKTASRGK